jgi:predicted nucleic acid-binding protein
MRALVDSDVPVAVIVGNEAQSADSLLVLKDAINGRFEAMATPLIMANVMYVLRRKWRLSRPTTWKADIAEVMTRMLGTFTLIPVDERDFLAAFSSAFSDHEDGVQHFAALRSRKVDLIITCNVKHFAKSALPVSSPGEFHRSLPEP